MGHLRNGHTDWTIPLIPCQADKQMCLWGTAVSFVMSLPYHSGHLGYIYSLPSHLHPHHYIDHHDYVNNQYVMPINSPPNELLGTCHKQLICHYLCLACTLYSHHVYLDFVTHNVGDSQVLHTPHEKPLIKWIPNKWIRLFVKFVSWHAHNFCHNMSFAIKSNFGK